MHQWSCCQNEFFHCLLAFNIHKHVIGPSESLVATCLQDHPTCVLVQIARLELNSDISISQHFQNWQVIH